VCVCVCQGLIGQSIFQDGENVERALSDLMGCCGWCKWVTGPMGECSVDGGVGMPAALWQMYHSDKLVEWLMGNEPSRLLLPEWPRPVCPWTWEPVDDGVGVGEGELEGDESLSLSLSGLSES
jgi:hypothetical protein